ncbi:16S rRNA (uracil(1498)-N(3))-methyltransferase [Microbacterium sp. NPDC091313]
MALHFLSDDATAADVGDEVELTGAEAHHAAQVRRLRTGERVSVGDGRGVWLDGETVSVTPRQVVVRVSARTRTPAPAERVVLVQALAKGDRDELAVQAATELGVDEIVPWQAERSVSRWDGKVDKGLARWRTIVREAAKQAHRAWIPEVTPPVGLPELAGRAGGGRMLVLDPRADARLSDLQWGAGGDIVLVVGPEGGISDGELDALVAAGAHRVRLGDTVLRTSTAGAAALSVVSVRLGRW